MRWTPLAGLVGALATASVLGACSPGRLPSPAAPVRAISEWPAYGGDEGGQRFVDLDGIRPDNLDSLKLAWTYRHGDVSDGHGENPSESAFENTPVLVDGTLYLCTPFNRIIALDPVSGTER